jgi:diguanylate cyclase (GGDEF)-like protein
LWNGYLCQSSHSPPLLLTHIDNFKLLNDAYGHDVGDLLLIEVTRRIVACL